MVEIRQRYDEIDILKSFGIILMIMGHIGFGRTFDYWIHSFHMPMFYLISGLLYRKSDLSFNDFTKKKAKSLLVPYIVFAIFHLAIWYTLLFVFKKNITLQPIISIFTFNTYNMPISGALWFLTSLFFVDVLYYLINRISDKKYKYTIIVILSLLGCIMPYYYRLPWALDTSLMAVGLYSIGVIGKKYIIKNNNIYVGVTAILLGTSLTFFNSYINVREGWYGDILLYYIVAILMAYGLYCISIRFKSMKYENILINELKFIGKNSLVYVCLNQLILLVPNKSATYISSTPILLIYKILVLILALFLLHILVKILNLDKFKWVLGK